MSHVPVLLEYSSTMVRRNCRSSVRLGLQQNALGEAGGVAMAKALGKGATPQLQQLVLDDNRLGKRGAAALAAAIAKGALPKLESVHVQRMRLTAAGRRLLDEAASASGGRLEIVHGLVDAEPQGVLSQVRRRSGFCVVL